LRTTRKSTVDAVNQISVADADDALQKPDDAPVTF